MALELTVGVLVTVVLVLFISAIFAVVEHWRESLIVVAALFAIWVVGNRTIAVAKRLGFVARPPAEAVR